MATSREIIRKLMKDGWVEVGVKGSHHQFKHPRRKGKVTVPPSQTTTAPGNAALNQQTGGLEINATKGIQP